MKNHIVAAAILATSGLLGCTETHEIVITPLPASTKIVSQKKVSKGKYTASIQHVSGKRTANVVEVFDIGPTIDDDGNMVGPHSLYRVVQTSRWTFGKQTATPLIVKKVEPKDQLAEAIARANRAATEAEAVNNALQAKFAQKTQDQSPDPTPNIPAREEVMAGFSMPSPTPDADANALEKYTAEQKAKGQ